MAKRNRERAPRDRKRPYGFPKPPCTPPFPGDPEPVDPRGPETLTGPDPLKLLERKMRRRKKR